MTQTMTKTEPKIDHPVEDMGMLLSSQNCEKVEMEMEGPINLKGKLETILEDAKSRAKQKESELNAKASTATMKSSTSVESVNKANRKLNHSRSSNRASKLNPKAANFNTRSFKNSYNKSVNSMPNLNSESVNSLKKQNSMNPYASYSDVCKGLFSSSQSQTRKTNLEMSQIASDEISPGLNAGKKLPRNGVCNSMDLKEMLKQYIFKKCSLNSHCNGEDFDGTALESLTKLSFVQSLQAVEHYGASVSERIVKKPAYLMGIIRGQESHWDNSRAAAQLEGGALQLLHLPKRLLLQIGHCCIRGNCLPSDFTPEVILSLHSLTTEYAIKAVNAFDTNKRIVAGCRGGVVNRPRFLQRLIENVIQQNPISLETIKREQRGREEKEKGSKDRSQFSSPKSFLSLLGSNSSSNRSMSCPDSGNENNGEERLSVEEKMKFLERELTDRIERERRLRQELGNLRVQVGYWEKECHRLNSTITHILHNRQ